MKLMPTAGLVQYGHYLINGRKLGARRYWSLGTLNGKKAYIQTHVTIKNVLARKMETGKQ